MDDLKLDYLWVVYPGSQTYSLDKNFQVAPLKQVLTQIRRLAKRN